jgi:hypothetical protein
VDLKSETRDSISIAWSLVTRCRRLCETPNLCVYVESHVEYATDIEGILIPKWQRIKE